MRNNNTNIKELAFDYYCKGLKAVEIGKLLDLSFRTVQGYMSSEKWKEKREEIQEREREKIINVYEKSLRKLKRAQSIEAISTK
jgi:uncharacterized protein YjcR